jgi:hypothetical protein
MVYEKLIGRSGASARYRLERLSSAIIEQGPPISLSKFLRNHFSLAGMRKMASIILCPGSLGDLPGSAAKGIFK